MGTLAVGLPLGPSVVRFVAVALGALVLASRTRWVWPLPALALVGAQLVVAVDGVSRGTPQPLGVGWFLSRSETGGPMHSTLWVGAVVDLTLALAPALVLVLTSDRPTRRTLAATDTAVIALAVFGVLAYAQACAMRGTGDTALREFVLLLPVLLFAVTLGTSSRWWPLLGGCFAAALVGGGEPGLALLRGSTDMSRGAALGAMRPAITVALLVGAWPLVTRWVRRAEERPWSLVVACNALNIADALLTSSALRAHEAVEANPVIHVIGLPAKVILVGVASVLVARWRPRLLLVPIVVLAAVFMWHLAGIAMRP
jgi:hypothetical protein